MSRERWSFPYLYPFLFLTICCEFIVGTLLASLAVLQRVFCTVVQLLVLGVNNLIHNFSEAWPRLCFVRYFVSNRRVRVAPGILCDILYCDYKGHIDDNWSIFLSSFTIQFYFLYKEAKAIDIWFDLDIIFSIVMALKNVKTLNSLDPTTRYQNPRVLITWARPALWICARLWCGHFGKAVLLAANCPATTLVEHIRRRPTHSDAGQPILDVCPASPAPWSRSSSPWWSSHQANRLGLPTDMSIKYRLC